MFKKDGLKRCNLPNFRREIKKYSGNILHVPIPILKKRINICIPVNFRRKQINYSEIKRVPMNNLTTNEESEESMNIEAIYIYFATIINGFFRLGITI